MPVIKNLFDYINATDIAAYVTEKPENKVPYFAETLFPAQRQLGTDISWLKGANGLPVAIQPSEYDVKASHGASVGKIDEDHLYYLMSRGLSKHDAMHLVTYGYFLPVLEFISVESLKERFSDVLKEKVGL